MIDLANVRQPAVAPYTICEILSLASSNGGLACARCATGALLGGYTAATYGIAVGTAAPGICHVS